MNQSRGEAHVSLTPSFMVLDMNVMIRYVLIVIALATVNAAAEAAQGRSKPLPPVQVSITPVQLGLASSNIKPGDTVEFRVNVLSSVDASEMRIINTLDGGAELVSGDLIWTGKAQKGQEISIIFEVRASAKGKGNIRTKIEVYAEHNLLFSTRNIYEIGAPEPTKPGQPRGVRKDSKGNEVIEYR